MLFICRRRLTIYWRHVYQFWRELIKADICWLVYCISLLHRRRRRQKLVILGGSPGLVVMGGDSHSEGRGFESLIWCLFEKTENKRKRGRGWPFEIKIHFLFLITNLPNSSNQSHRVLYTFKCLIIMDHSLPLFRLLLAFSNKHQNNFSTMWKKCSSSIRYWNSNPQPLDMSLPTITTRPGLQPLT